MPSNTSIAILDGKASPLTHTFTPTRLDAVSGASYRDMSMSPMGVADTINYRMNDRPKVRQVSLSLRRPRAVTETVNGVTNTKMADFGSVGITVNVPVTWAEADIKDLRVMASKLLLDALVAAGVDRGEYTY